MRADAKPALPPRAHSLLDGDNVPARPLPALPGSFALPGNANGGGSDASRDRASAADDTTVEGDVLLGDGAPPERSVVSDAVTVTTPARTRPAFEFDNLSDSLSDPDNIPDALELPVAPPACALCHAGVPSAFGEPPLPAAALFRLPKHSAADVRAAAGEIAAKRARARRQRARASTAPVDGGREYARALDDATRPDAERKSGPDGLSAPRMRALAAVVGCVVRARVREPAAGEAMFADALRAFVDSADPLTRCVAFALLTDVTKQATHIRPVADDGLERLCARMLAEHVLTMRAREQSRAVWDRAARAAVIVFGNGETPLTPTHRAALRALRAHLPAHRHLDGARALIALAGPRSPPPPPGSPPVPEAPDPDCVDAAAHLYASTPSLAARRALFRELLRAAVWTAARALGINDEAAADQAALLGVVLEAHDAGAALVLEFRHGAGGVVEALVREVFIEPLQRYPAAELAEGDSGDGSARWRRLAAPASPSPDADADPAERAYALSERRHARAVRAAHKVLNKTLAVQALHELARMADASADSRRRAADDKEPAVRALADATDAVRGLRKRGRDGKGAEPARSLKKLHAAVSTLAGAPPSPRAAVGLAELVLEAVLLRPAFATPGSSPTGPDCAAGEFLAGQRHAVRAMLAQANVGLFLGLLQLTRGEWYLRRVSLMRQALVELVGAVPDRGGLLEGFKDDADTAVAYRAEVVYSNYAGDSDDTDEEVKPRRRRTPVAAAAMQADGGAKLFRNIGVPRQPKFV